MLLLVYVQSSQYGKADGVMELMQQLDLCVEIVFVLELVNSSLQAAKTILSRYSRVEDFKDPLAIWKVCAMPS